MPPFKLIQNAKETYTLVFLHVKPGAKTNRLVAVNEDHFDVAIAAPARDGEANDEVRSFVAELVGAKVRDVSVIQGHKARDKILRVEGEKFNQKQQHYNDYFI